MIRAVACALLLLAGGLTPAYAEAPAPGASPSPLQARVAVDVVNLNDASEEQLMLLPGIGPAKARAIVARRQVHPFRRIDELLKVKGIGRKSLGRLRPYLTIAGATTLHQEVKFLRR